MVISKEPAINIALFTGYVRYSEAGPCLGRFPGMIGHNPSVSKFHRLVTNCDLSGFPLLNWVYSLDSSRMMGGVFEVLNLQPVTFSHSTCSSVTRGSVLPVHWPGWPSLWTMKNEVVLSNWCGWAIHVGWKLVWPTLIILYMSWFNIRNFTIIFLS